LYEAENIKMMVDRKSNSKRKDKPYIAFLKTHMRKKIESVFLIPTELIKPII
jgi:hypothetical protein